jgi:integrase
MSSKQLFSRARSDFRNFVRAADTAVETQVAGGIPFVRWPDGRWCIEANLFMLQLQEEGKALNPSGSTLATYAAYISPLIRYCFQESISFLQLKDEDLNQIKNGFDGVKSPAKNGAVSDTAARSMTIVWLNFLHLVSRYHDDTGLLGEAGRITATRNLRSLATGSGKSLSMASWHYGALLEKKHAESAKPVRPIVANALVQLCEEAIKSESEFLQRRRLVMLALMLGTGIRRSELTSLRVGDITRALRRTYPFGHLTGGTIDHDAYLEIVSRKTKQRSGRMVPVGAKLLNVMDLYLKSRSALMKSLGRNSSSPAGAFLVSHSDGRGLTPNTITLEIHLLSAGAGLTEQSSPNSIRAFHIVQRYADLFANFHVFDRMQFDQKFALDRDFRSKFEDINLSAGVTLPKRYLESAFSEAKVTEETQKLLKVCLAAHSG